MKQRSIAALLTCFNRRSLTLRCLESLTTNTPPDCRLTVYLVDDGSTDGTGDAVAAEFPNVRLITGSGDLYWSRGMATAWTMALNGSHDGFLWVNDDVELCEDALARLLDQLDRLETAQGPAIILIGATMDPESGSTTYSGYRRLSSWHPTRVEMVEPSVDECQRVDTFNGNIALVTSSAVERIGIIDGSFSHAVGDFDYGLRAAEAGVPVMLLPGHLGSCVQRPATKLTLRTVFTVKGLPPRDWIRICFRHSPWWAWPLLMPAPYIRATLRSAVDAGQDLRQRLSR